jgi:hypothetical protein
VWSHWSLRVLPSHLKHALTSLIIKKNITVVVICISSSTTPTGTMPWRCMEEWTYRSTFFLTVALAGDEWSASHPGCFIQGQQSPKCPLHRRIGGPQSQFEWCRREEILDPTRTSTPLSSRLQPVTIPTALSWLLMDSAQLQNAPYYIQHQEVRKIWHFTQ